MPTWWNSLLNIGMLNLHSQYHVCWCPSDTKTQAIGCHEIDLVHIWYSITHYTYIELCIDHGVCVVREDNFVKCRYYWNPWCRLTSVESYHQSCLSLHWQGDKTGIKCHSGTCNSVIYQGSGLLKYLSIHNFLHFNIYQRKVGLPMNHPKN